MGLELIKTGDVDTAELSSSLQTPKSSPAIPRAASPTPTSTPPTTILHESSSAISKDGSLLAIGKHNLLLLFKVSGSWRITQVLDEEQQADDYVTQLAIIPLQKSAYPHVVVAGYLSGYVRIYSPYAVQLVAQKFHNACVRRLVVCTSGLADVGVMVLYDGGIIASLTNFNLPDPAALAQQTEHASSSAATAAVVSYRKWSLIGMELVTDAIFVSPQHGAPAAGRVISVGRNPIVSFYTVTEEQNSPLSLAVALASTVASKLTSAVVSIAKNWWFGAPAGSESPKTPRDKKEKENDVTASSPAISLGVRWGVSDAQRQLNSLLEAPTTALAVATDGYGRVLLVDTRSCVIVRMWKGYRDAQCGWIVDGRTLYLVLHAPRRGLLEVWKMRHGSRVSAQSVGTGWRLLPAVDTCFIMDKTGNVFQLVVKE